MKEINRDFLKSKIKYQDTTYTYRTCIGGCYVCSSSCSPGTCLCGKCKCFENSSNIEKLSSIYS